MKTTSGGAFVFLGLWALVIVLVPYYLFGGTPTKELTVKLVERMAREPVKVESGVPQLADFVMAGLIGLTFLTLGLRLSQQSWPGVKMLGLFVACTIVVNGAWALLSPDGAFAYLKNSLYYVYDLLLLLTFLTLYSTYGEKMLRVTLYAVMASVFLLTLLSPLGMISTSLRQRLFFNNFNQLGYYGVLTASLFFLAARHIPVPLKFQVPFYLAATYLVALSLSKAAILALALLLLVVFVKRPALMVLAVVVLTGGLLVTEATMQISEKLEKRLTAEEKDESMAKRGYDRIFNHPQYLIYGAGEGEYDRFISEHEGEMHSTPGTVLFSYGIIGLTLFGWALLRVCRSVHWADAFALVPGLIYSLAHQGLRSTLFWTLLAFLCALARPRPVEEPARPSRRRTVAPVDQGSVPVLTG